MHCSYSIDKQTFVINHMLFKVEIFIRFEIVHPIHQLQITEYRDWLLGRNGSFLLLFRKFDFKPSGMLCGTPNGIGICDRVENMYATNTKINIAVCVCMIVCFMNVVKQSKSMLFAVVCACVGGYSTGINTWRRIPHIHTHTHSIKPWSIS